jgi:AcrR family transcriptional regulator
MTKQKSEHATAEKILQAAQDIFMVKGFEGASINDIANQAKINKSLIYHHFSNKIDLWKAVKKNLLEKHVGQEIFQVDFPMDSFRNFLTSFVTLRFKFYDDNSAIVRLITWQRLENSQDDIEGIQETKFTSVTSQIKEFQQRGEVRPELDPEMVNYFIMTTASMAFMERPAFFDEPNAKKKFLELLIESLFLAFSTSKVPQNSYEPRIYTL